MAGIVDGDGQPIVAADAVEEGRVRLGYVSLPRKAQDCEFLLADWDEQELADAEATARDAIRLLRSGRFEFDREVTKVKWFGHDPLERLLAEGWQSAGEDDAEAETGGER